MDALVSIMVLLGMLFLVVLPEVVANHKGIAVTWGQMLGWLLFGLFVPVISLIVALIMQPRESGDGGT